jgi:hypothetical protein
MPNRISASVTTLFNADFTVMKGCLIPHEVISEYGKHNQHSNSHRFLLRDSVWSLPDVRDITEELTDAAEYQIPR